mmetsp:Transcript_66042/g.157926  ORF Transcript_66042/g.157926 Transcript_66042/m.157926 type:complete len:256 (+) Transcript_66042:66-833(+)
MKVHRFEVGYSKSNMATCRVCMAKIPKGVLRIGHLQDAPQGDSAMTFAAGATRWHHFECFPRMRGAKWMVVNLPSDVTIIDGYDDIEVNDQKVLKTMWEALLSGESETKAGSSSSSTSSSVKKRPAAASSRSEPPSKKGKLSALTSTQGELTIAQFKKVQKLEEALRESTSAQLQAELSKNLQVSAGKKEDLVRRVAEGRVLGALPYCPKCSKGRIHWSRIGGWFSCPGYYDGGSGTQKRCSFRTKDLKRKKWVK